MNINMGYNKVVMEKCKKLKEYAQYIARVRKYLDCSYTIEAAIDKATDECIEEGILEQLLRNNRGEVRSMLLTQYDEQAHIEYEKELSFEEGKQEGKDELVIKMLKNGMTAASICEMTELDIGYVEKIRKRLL